MDLPTTDIRTWIDGSTGHIVLDRPKALNSLTREMCLGIEDALRGWIDHDDVAQVVIHSASERAFCAGGDVRRVREQILAGDSVEPDGFFRDEYRLNALIAGYPKPYIAVIDGVVMGGGLGVSLHGRHRVVTERLVAAMPEMAIGFVPDVGVTWASQRLVGSLGRPSRGLAVFIGLTGYRLTAADALFAGWATDYIRSVDVPRFIEAIGTHGVDAAAEAFGLSDSAAGESWLAAHVADIEFAFDQPDWASVAEALESDHVDPAFVELTRELLSGAAPTSLVAGAELYRANQAAGDVGAGLDNEYRVGQLLRRDPNFAEGVRAVLVDKDRTPAFRPATAAEVDPEPYRSALAAG